MYTFSLPSGWSCPGAKDCLSKAVLDNTSQKYSIKDGEKTKFRCFSATQEVVYKGVREQRQYNFNLLRNAKTMPNMASLILESIPQNASIIRIHVGGDFFNEDYMRAWCFAAAKMPKVTFYAYTKSVNYWVNLANEKVIPTNFKLNASKGGKFDNLIEKHKLKFAEVVYSEQEAKDKQLEIDHDDTHAFMQDKSFALLLHGVQPANTQASEALKQLKGLGSYSSKNKQNAGQNSRTSKKETSG